MNLAEIKSNTQPFYLEYMGDSITGRYRLARITPEWTAKLDVTPDDDSLKIVNLFCEVVADWDVIDAPIPYGPEMEFVVGDVIAYEGVAYRVHSFDETYNPQANGHAPSPEDLPSERGSRGKYGPFELENVGDADHLYPVWLTKDQVKRIPGPIINKCLEAIMRASRGDVDDAKKGV